ncbi:MAG: fibrobacter succinogenes major paralogous domain-containing protein [Bacteroidia bacterium]|nr:fibrobacter succinogenes major paralogous domain-containing protein [Bacteroidia bacterium]
MDEIKIGNQIWSAQNLNVNHFINCNLINEIDSQEKMKRYSESSDGLSAFYSINYNSKNDEKFGKLYNYFCLIDYRGLLPRGWHIPNYEEWMVLIKFLGGAEIAGKKMKSVFGWESDTIKEAPNYNIPSEENLSKFNALPAGYYSFDLPLEYGDYGNNGFSANFWIMGPINTNTRNNPQANSIQLQSNSNSVVFGQTNVFNFLSIRCLKD